MSRKLTMLAHHNSQLFYISKHSSRKQTKSLLNIAYHPDDSLAQRILGYMYAYTVECSTNKEDSIN